MAKVEAELRRSQASSFQNSWRNDGCMMSEVLQVSLCESQRRSERRR